MADGSVPQKGASVTALGDLIERDGVLFYQPPPYKDGRKSRMRPAARMLALLAGDAHYFSGIPCKNGHTGLRAVARGGCLECANDRVKAAYWENPEKARAKAAAIRAADPEAARMATRRYYWKNPEKARGRAKEDYYQNRSARLAVAREWKRLNRAKANAGTRRWRKNNYEHVRLYSVRYRADNSAKIAAQSAMHRALHKTERALYERSRRARKRNADGSHTIDDVHRILKAQRYRCAYCRMPIRQKYHVDHIVPLARDGSDSPYNLQCTCVRCNLSKNARDAIDFAQSVGLLV